MTRWVLLVEDNPDDRDLLVHAWHRLGLPARLEVVHDGLAALEVLADHGRQGPAVVLLDLKMPGADGFRVLERLRAADSRVPPVVVLTSSDEPTDVERSYALGASGYVVKPVKPDGYLEAVASIGTFWTRTNHPSPQESGREPASAPAAG
jgi:CheY-like chemotaxis protein